MTDWIKNQKAGPFSNEDQPTSNVFIADFIELKNFQFCRTVIGLNAKIFNDLATCECNENDKINDAQNQSETGSDKEDETSTNVIES